MPFSYRNIGSRTFAFGALAEVGIIETEDGSAMSQLSSISSMRAFFETDGPPALLVGAQRAICFLLPGLFVCLWWALFGNCLGEEATYRQVDQELYC